MYIKKLRMNKTTKYTLFSIYMIFKDVCYHELYKLLVSSMKNVFCKNKNISLNNLI